MPLTVSVWHRDCHCQSHCLRLRCHSVSDRLGQPETRLTGTAAGSLAAAAGNDDQDHDDSDDCQCQWLLSCHCRGRHRDPGSDDRLPGTGQWLCQWQCHWPEPERHAP
eukprot:613597-Rhodomonas_salina.1